MKTTYEKFIEANNKLFKCFESVSADKWSALSSDEQNNLCSAEREAVSQFLANNQVGFRNLIKERLEILGHQ